MKILIMAGGSGERFWPLSTISRPKQLLQLITGKSMIRETFARVLKIVNMEDIYIATNEIQASAISAEIPELRQRNIIIEPAFKDTAAAIAYGSTIIERDSPDNPTIVVLASDHLIADVDSFLDALKTASIESEKNSIVTLGIKPSKPETGYGYIKIEDNVIGVPTKAIEFMEKPNYETALKYIKDGSFVWNSGMFIFKYNIIMEEIKNYVPNHYEVILDIKKVIGQSIGLELSHIAKPFFNRFERISIDFAIMEKFKIIKCIPVDFGWNDVGGFNSLDEIFNKDINGNISKDCKYIYIDSSNNIVISDRKNKLITSIGANNMIIVDTDESLLVCNKNDGQRIKELLKLINLVNINVN